jgi:hypothetical protein
VLVFSQLVVYALPIVPMTVPMLLLLLGLVEMNSFGYWVLYSGSLLVALTMDAFAYVGLYRIALAAARGHRAEFGLLFSGSDRFLAMLGTIGLLFVILAFGFTLLIVPGILLALGLFLSAMFVVDQNLGPVDALKASWAATAGHKIHLFLFGLVAFGISLGGYMACFVGILAVIPLLSVAHAIIYLRLSGHGGGAQESFAGQAYFPRPLGGFGPGGGYEPQGGGGFGGSPEGYGGAPGGGQGGPPPGAGGYGPPGGGGYGPPG